MNDSREIIFAAVRRGLRNSEQFTAKRDSRSPLKVIPNNDFESMFDKFRMELKKLGGDVVVFDNEGSAHKFIADRVGKNIFIYDELSSLRKNFAANTNNPVTIKTSSDFDPNYDKRQAAAFDSAISSCAACVAETGTVVLENRMRLPAALVEKLFIIAEPSVLVPSLDELFTDKYRDFKGSNLFLITGPSRTADIEKELVTGVHGPKEVYVIFIKQ
ncbi:MAG: LUD domain-containing protein [Candidatus Kryptoniota bacterium]